MIIAALVLLMVPACSSSPASVRSMHAAEKLTAEAMRGELRGMVIALLADLDVAFAFQRRLGFRYKALANKVDGKVAAKQVEDALVALQKKEKENAAKLKEGRADLEATDINWGFYNRAWNKTEKWQGRVGISEESQDGLADSAGSITKAVMARQKAKAEAKAAKAAAAAKESD